MELILHIGGEKTGTTTLQRYLSANSARLLADFRLLYPAKPPLLFKAAHFPLINTLMPAAPLEFMRDHVVVAPDTMREALAAMVAEAKPERVVLSAEHFSSRMSLADIRRLAEWIKNMGLFDAVRVVFYVRPQDDLAVSAFSTRLRVGWRGWISEARYNPDNPYFNHFRTAELWASCFGGAAMMVRSYDRASADIVRDFLLAIGVPADDPETPAPRLNQGFTYEGLRLLHLVNQHLALHGDVGVANQRIEQDVESRRRFTRLLKDKKICAGGRPADLVLAADARARIQSAYGAANAKLREKYGVELVLAEVPDAAAAVPLLPDTDILAKTMAEMVRLLPKRMG